MKRITFLLCLGFVACNNQVKKEPILQKPVIDGEFVHIFNPNDNDTRSREDST